MKKQNSLQQVFDELTPHLVSILIDTETLKPYVNILIPNDWKLKTNTCFSILKKQTKGHLSLLEVRLVDLTLSVDDLLGYVTDIINTNKKRVEAEQKIQEEFERLKKELELKLKQTIGLNENDELIDLNQIESIEPEQQEVYQPQTQQIQESVEQNYVYNTGIENIDPNDDYYSNTRHGKKAKIDNETVNKFKNGGFEFDMERDEE